MDDSENARDGDGQPARLLWSAEEVATALGIKPSCFYEHVRHSLPSIRIGARVLFDPEDVRAWVAEHKVGAPRDGEVSPWTAQAGSQRASTSTRSREEANQRLLQIARGRNVGRSKAAKP